MESGTNKESKAASSEEALSPPRPEVAAAGAGEDDAGAAAVSPPAPAASTRPYYECVFCKRGFTTAQALGGHMNIHRRDRAKPNRDTPTGITSVSRNVECYNQYRRHLAYPPASPPATTAPMSSSSSSFSMYYRRMGASAGVDGEAASPSRTSPRELSLFGEAALDHDLHPGLGCHGLDRDGSRTPEEWQRQAGEPERELDLELRLGRRPRH